MTQFSRETDSLTLTTLVYSSCSTQIIILQERSRKKESPVSSRNLSVMLPLGANQYQLVLTQLMALKAVSIPRSISRWVKAALSRPSLTVIVKHNDGTTESFLNYWRFQINNLEVKEQTEQEWPEAKSTCGENTWVCRYSCFKVICVCACRLHSYKYRIWSELSYIITSSPVTGVSDSPSLIHESYYSLSDLAVRHVDFTKAGFHCSDSCVPNRVNIWIQVFGSWCLSMQDTEGSHDPCIDGLYLRCSSALSLLLHHPHKQLHSFHSVIKV